MKLSTRVILYETKAGQHYLSSRAYYLFSLMGHKHVQILNGGMTKWLSEGRQTQGELANEQDYSYGIRPERINLFEEVVALEGTEQAEIIDVRPENLVAQGDISGSKKIMLKNFFNPDTNLVRSKEEVVAALSGVDLSKPVIC